MLVHQAAESLSLEERLQRAEDLNAELSQQLKQMLDRQTTLERRLLGRNRHRWDVLEKIADYFMGADVAGDYVEFGVYQGETFAHACNFMGPMFPDMRFWAFDSFEGLPMPRSGLDEINGYSGGFFKGQFACSEDAFYSYLQEQKVDLSKVTTIKGWYSETLSKGENSIPSIEKVALAWVDCDLYESTVPVLDYLTDKISVGSVILFDDWRCFRNLSDRGQQKACREWLVRNPHIKLNLLIDNDYNGYAFSVASC